ncbi:MAG: TolC family protein [Chitinophagaceae bacterium]|nr:TolC family protein [Chitinophagaceae bacterium]
MKYSLVTRALAGGWLILATGFGAISQEQAIDRYIRIAMDSNIVVQQKHISLDKALLSLKTAKSLYAPSVSFLAGYQSGDGGRNISLPLGDLLNNAYATLNQLTGSQQFPHLENQSVNFFPRDFYDAKIRTTLPIINPDIGYGKQISAYQAQLQEYELAAYKRELVKEIRIAYYNHLQALHTVAIHESARQLALEGKRVNERLLERGKGLPAYVLRSESEIAVIDSRLTQVNQEVENSRLYFNMLLNRTADAAIDTSFDEDRAMLAYLPEMPGATDMEKREELQSLSTLTLINETVLKMNKGFRIPRLNGFLDLGAQSEGLKYNRQSRYYMAGLQMEIPLFSANRNINKIRESELNIRDARLGLERLSKQLALSSRVAQNNLNTARKNYQSSLAQLRSAEAYQRLIERGYQAGTHTYIETVDARNQLTAARLAATLGKFQVLQAAAVLERETASYSINPKNTDNE